MSELKLSDIRWIGDELAMALTERGLTVQVLATMTGDELLAKYPFVGTINAWLLTSEAAYLIEQVEAGLWDAEAKDDLETTLEELAALEIREAKARIRPEMVWPPPEGTEPPPVTQSARVRRIQVQREKAEESERQRAWLAARLEKDKAEESERQRALRDGQEGEEAEE
jgi:signal transduction histidine kinase